MSKSIELKVTGMSCGHCEAAVNKALLSLDGVIKAAADHQAGMVKLELDKEVDHEVLIDAVKTAGYEAA